MRNFGSPWRDTLSRLAADLYDPKLKTHKLQGGLAERWACSVTHSVRIIFQLVEHEGDDAILLLNVGTHDDVY